MSRANDILDALTAEEIALYTANPSTEGHIVVDDNRHVTVPADLKRIAVQYDHNVETVTFDCVRFWDGLDMSSMVVYINYRLPDGTVGAHIAENVTTDPDIPNVMHFTWTITRDITAIKGTVSFLVCIKNVDTFGNEVNHWNSELCNDIYIAEGLEGYETIVEENPDIITDLLLRMASVEEVKTEYTQAVTDAEAAATRAESAADDANAKAAMMSRVVHVTGMSATDIMSQKGTTMALNNCSGAILATASCEGGIANDTITLTDGDDKLVNRITVYGRTRQNGTPTPDSPSEVICAGDDGFFGVGHGKFVPDALMGEICELKGEFIITGLPLCSTDYAKDELNYVLNGAATVTKRVGRVRLTASNITGVTVNDGLGNFFYTNIVGADGENSLNIPICNRFLGVSYDNRATADYLNVFRCFLGTDGRIILRNAANDNRFVTVEDMQSFVTNNEVVVVYPLAEEYTIDLSTDDVVSLNNVRTYKGKTGLSTTAGCPMTVEYVVDTKAYIDNKFAELQAMLTE